ncbi:MAG: HAD family hydrolase [Adhaeribacter sp.]
MIAVLIFAMDPLKKAFIYDLDNTLYGVPTIGDTLFAPLYELIQDSGQFLGSFEKVREDLMRQPFQVVAAKYHFSDSLTRQGIELLRNLEYEGEILPFDDYSQILHIPGDRFLVTTGFLSLQESKIRNMGIEDDFLEIHIVDPDNKLRTKKEVFAEILDRHGLLPEEVLVIGDDPESELQAARDLGMETVLYDKYQRQPKGVATFRISDFNQLRDLMQSRK